MQYIEHKIFKKLEIIFFRVTRFVVLRGELCAVEATATEGRGVVEKMLKTFFA